jgi:peptidoglycan/xylan/chitin deacetylase (PgdA/CDA1 family)
MSPGSTSPSLLFVNYHYIREPTQYQYPGIHPISLADFTAQLDWLSDNFYVATPEEAEAFVWRKEALPSDSVVLTFDDGLTDQYNIARKVLNPRNIKGVFFVTSRPLTDRHANTLQKTHWLRATMGPHEFQDRLLAALPSQWQAKIYDSKVRAAAEKIYVYDKPKIGRVKYLINFIVPEALMDELSSQMLVDQGISEVDFCAATYMSEENVRELHREGHKIGAHGHTHLPFTRIPDGDSTEITSNISFLASLTDIAPNWVSYPFGRDWAIPEDTKAFCQRHDFLIGLSLNLGWNTGMESPYLLNRVNTNDVAAVTAHKILRSDSQAIVSNS